MASKSSAPAPVLDSRLIPRLSLGFLFFLTTLGALLSALARSAGQGTGLAIAGLAMVGFVTAAFTAFVALFLFCRMVAWVRGDHEPASNPGSPFSEHQLPPQIVPPREKPS